jgi:hypothetical protein
VRCPHCGKEVRLQLGSAEKRLEFHLGTETGVEQAKRKRAKTNAERQRAYRERQKGK